MAPQPEGGGLVSYQAAVEADWAKVAAEFNGQLMFQREFSNVGTVLVGSGPGDIWFTLDYEFQRHASMFLFNGKKHGPESPDNYYFNATDTAAYHRMMERFRALCDTAQHVEVEP